METERIERDLNPSRQLINDKASLAVLRLDEHLGKALGYITRLRGAMGRIDKDLWPEESVQADLESMMTRLNEIPA